jgi:Dipeptidyl peptidase IV (DPP IV) N-terminal region.
VRDNNLFIVPIDSGEIVQLTDVQPKKRDPRETDSQKFVKDEEQKLIEHTRVQAEKKKKTEDKDKARALPKLELADRQTATDLQLSPDGTHVFVLIVERTETAKRTNVPNYVTESSYTEDIPARTFVGDAQDNRSLAILNVDTGKSVTAAIDGADTKSAKDAKDAGDGKDAKDTKGAVRWGMPLLSDDGTLAVAHVRAANNKDRWLVTVDPESGKTRVLDGFTTTRGSAKLADSVPVDPSYGLLPDQKRVWFLSERDGWMHLYSLDATGRSPPRVS